MSHRLRLLPAVAALGVAAAACGGSSSPHSAVADNPVVGTSSASSTSTTVPNTTTSSAAAAVTTTPSAAASGAGTSSAPDASTAATGSSGSTGSKAAPAPAHQPYPFEKAGTYTYHLTGSASGSLGKQNIDTQSSDVVDAPNGNQQHSVQQSKSGGQDGTQDQTVAYGSDGVRLADVKISSTGFNEEFAAAKPVMYFPASPSGKTWSWTMKSTDGKYTLTGQFKVLSTNTTASTEGGQALKTVELSAILKITGDQLELTVNQTDWVNTATMLIVKEHAVTDGKAYGATLHSDTTRVLKSTQPS